MARPAFALTLFVTLHSATMAQTCQTPNLEAQGTAMKSSGFWQAIGPVKRLRLAVPGLVVELSQTEVAQGLEAHLSALQGDPLGRVGVSGISVLTRPDVSTRRAARAISRAAVAIRVGGPRFFVKRSSVSFLTPSRVGILAGWGCIDYTRLHHSFALI